MKDILIVKVLSGVMSREGWAHCFSLQVMLDSGQKEFQHIYSPNILEFVQWIVSTDSRNVAAT